MRILPVIAAVTAAFLVVACSSPTPPPGVTVVSYSAMDDGGIRVINRGYNPDRQMWQQSVGQAYFTGASNRAAMKVSFIGPFYGGYNVIALDREYRHALVCGPDRNYLWLLSRTPTISTEMKQQMLDIATRQGFDVTKLIWVKQLH